MKLTETKLRKLIREYLHQLNETDSTLSFIGNIAKSKSLMNMGDDLKSKFGKNNVDFSLRPEAHYTIKYKGKKIVIINKKYADGADLVVGQIAVGYM
jgi:hypothetical protein